MLRKSVAGLGGVSGFGLNVLDGCDDGILLGGGFGSVSLTIVLLSTSASSVTEGGTTFTGGVSARLEEKPTSVEAVGFGLSEGVVDLDIGSRSCESERSSGIFAKLVLVGEPPVAVGASTGGLGV